MNVLRKGMVAILIVLLITSCSTNNKEDQTPTASKITIKPYSLTERENQLIQKTGVQNIEYFLLNGELKQGEDLRIEVELFENGKRQNEMLVSSGMVENRYDNEIISFGVSEPVKSSDEHTLNLFSGIPSGLAATYREHKISGSTFSKLINEKIVLTKDKPVYLAAWAGTTKNTMRSLGGATEAGPPEGIEEFELAFLYKITLIDLE